MATTIGMKAEGYYDVHSKEQRVAPGEFLPWKELATADLPMPSDH